MIALASGLLVVAAGQLDSATIEIDLAGTTATVRAVYHITRAPSDSVRFLLMRIAGQSVNLTGAAPFSSNPPACLPSAFRPMGADRAGPVPGWTAQT